MTMRHSVIQFEKNTVRKTADPKRMRIEVEKNRRAHEIGRSSGLFRVPQVLDYDEVKGEAVFERMRDVLPVRKTIVRPRPCMELVERIGRSLAVIHEQLDLPQEMVFPLPSEFAMPNNNVFLHGDYNIVNVCTAAGSPPLVVMDWQMTSQHGGQATYGSRYFDLLWFVNGMIWMPTVHCLYSDPVAMPAKVFLTAYFHEARMGDENDNLSQYAERLFSLKKPFRKQNSTWRNRFLLARCQWFTARFLKTLVREGR